MVGPEDQSVADPGETRDALQSCRTLQRTWALIGAAIAVVAIGSTQPSQVDAAYRVLQELRELGRVLEKNEKHIVNELEKEARFFLYEWVLLKCLGGLEAHGILDTPYRRTRSSVDAPDAPLPGGSTPYFAHLMSLTGILATAPLEDVDSAILEVGREAELTVLVPRDCVMNERIPSVDLARFLASYESGSTQSAFFATFEAHTPRDVRPLALSPDLGRPDVLVTIGAGTRVVTYGTPQPDGDSPPHLWLTLTHMRPPGGSGTRRLARELALALGVPHQNARPAFAGDRGLILRVRLPAVPIELRLSDYPQLPRAHPAPTVVAALERVRATSTRALAPFWEQLRGRTIDQSIASIHDRRTGDIVLGGIALPSSLVHWLAPVVLVVAGVFSLLHLTNLASLGPASISGVRFPWVAVFDSYFARFVVTPILWYLPAVALVSLALRGASDEDWVSRLSSGLEWFTRSLARESDPWSVGILAKAAIDGLNATSGVAARTWCLVGGVICVAIALRAHRITCRLGAARRTDTNTVSDPVAVAPRPRIGGESPGTAPSRSRNPDP